MVRSQKSRGNISTISGRAYKRQANLTSGVKEYLEACLGDEVTHVLFGRLGQTEWDQLTETTLLNKVKDMFLK